MLPWVTQILMLPWVTQIEFSPISDGTLLLSSDHFQCFLLSRRQKLRWYQEEFSAISPHGTIIP